MKIESAQITSACNAGLTGDIWEFVNLDTEKGPLSILTGVRIKRVNVFQS